MNCPKRPNDPDASVSGDLEPKNQQPSSSHDALLRVSGMTIQYLHTCNREVWFHTHFFDPDQSHDHLTLGRLIHERSFKKQGKKNLSIGGSMIDIVEHSDGQVVVSEVKKSSKMLGPTKKQLQYYLWLLREQGIHAHGIIRVPKERKTYRIEIPDDYREEITRNLKEIRRIAKMDSPPPFVKKPYCRQCAYYEFCMS